MSPGRPRSGAIVRGMGFCPNCGVGEGGRHRDACPGPIPSYLISPALVLTLAVAIAKRGHIGRDEFDTKVDQLFAMPLAELERTIAELGAMLKGPRP